MTIEKSELRYHLVLTIEATEPKRTLEITLGYKFRYELASYLKLARNLLDAGNEAQIKQTGGLILKAEGIDTQTGGSVGSHSR